MRKREIAEPERRQLTVMFCDLVGSTALAERLDPEELHALLARYQDTCADVIRRYEGHIARYVGDALLVYFGYPKAHEDDAQRAVRAGIGIVDAIHELNTVIDKPNVELAVRVGITTGLAVAGDIGIGGRVEEKAIVGETPNLAARLQALAEPNAVVIGASTYHLVEDLFECCDLGEQRVKGISKPVRAYRVGVESGAPNRFEAKATRGLSPLVGRAEEVSLLRKRWTQSTEGESQVVLLSGEAGVGKSRIVRAFQESLEGEIRNRVLYYCSPYHQNSALYPVIQQFKQGLRFEKNDSPAQQLEKLETAVRRLGLPVDDFLPLLASQIGLPVGDRHLPSSSTDQKKTLEALFDIIEAMTFQNPVLMVVEDAHWSDPSTLELIGLLIEQLRSARFLLVIIFRPEFVSPWGTRAHVTALTLNRLTRKDSVAMIANLSGGKALPAEIVDQIVAKTDGVPLFIEELTKAVLESDLLEDAGNRYVLAGPLQPLAIPASLQDSLMARLDRLAPAKEVAQLAATLGRKFSHEFLAAVSPVNGKALEEALLQLVKAELVYRRGIPPDARYEFKHALVQEAAYQSLLKRTRQLYHQRITRVLEEQFPQTAESEPELLAHHYTAAGLTEPAIEYWQRAGKRAAARSANVEAIGHFTRALDMLRVLPENRERVEKELSLQIALGALQIATKGYGSPEVERAYTRARELCQQVGETSRLFPVLQGLWAAYLTQGELRKGRNLAQELMLSAERAQDPELLLEAHCAIGESCFWLGELLSAREHLEQGFALYDVEKHRSHALLYGADPAVGCLTYGAYTLWLLGYPDQALRRARDALALASKIAHPFSIVRSISSIAMLHQFRGEMQAVQARAQEAITLAAEQGFPYWLAQVRFLQGRLLAEHGEETKGIAQMHGALTEYFATGARVRQPFCLSLLAEPYARVGENDEGLRLLAGALASVNQKGERWWESEVHRLTGKLLLDQGRQDVEAEACFHRALEVAGRQHAKSLELRAATSLSRLWHDQGKQKEAQELLAPIYGWFTEGLETADLKEARALLDELGAALESDTRLVGSIKN